jgi:hypothetical protein
MMSEQADKIFLLSHMLAGRFRSHNYLSEKLYFFFIKWEFLFVNWWKIEIIMTFQWILMVLVVALVDGEFIILKLSLKLKI